MPPINRIVTGGCHGIVRDMSNLCHSELVSARSIPGSKLVGKPKLRAGNQYFTADLKARAHSITEIQRFQTVAHELNSASGMRVFERQYYKKLLSNWRMGMQKAQGL